MHIVTRQKFNQVFETDPDVVEFAVVDSEVVHTMHVAVKLQPGSDHDTAIRRITSIIHPLTPPGVNVKIKTFE